MLDSVLRRAYVTLLLTSWLAIASVIGCSSDVTGSSGPDVSGTYVLQTIDGKALPVTTAIDGGTRYTEESGNTILRKDGSFTKNHFTGVYNSANVLTQIVPYAYNGTYVLSGTQITFNYPPNGADPASSVVGQVSDGVLTQTAIGMSWRFVRQP